VIHPELGNPKASTAKRLDECLSDLPSFETESGKRAAASPLYSVLADWIPGFLRDGLRALDGLPQTSGHPDEFVAVHARFAEFQVFLMLEVGRLFGTARSACESNAAIKGYLAVVIVTGIRRFKCACSALNRSVTSFKRWAS
jgi:hypothetical protein